MRTTADHLREVLKISLPRLREIGEEAGKPREEGKWSPKQVIGHLIDSAGNNQQKFVRTMADPNLEFPGYFQPHWVESQHYDLADWPELLVFWEAYNRHLARVIENVPAGALANEITIEGSGPFTLEFIMKDYVEHMKHHLRQIIPDADLADSFENVYNA